MGNRRQPLATSCTSYLCVRWLPRPVYGRYWRRDREAIVRLREGLLLPQEAIEPQAPRGVQVGRTLLRVEMGDGWRQRLRWALEQLAAASKVGEAHPKVDGAHGSESLKV